MNLQEFHAYHNPDGTYRIEANYTVKYGELERNGKLIVPRVRLTMEALADYNTCNILTFVTEEN